MAIQPTTKALPNDLPVEQRQKRKMVLLQRFWFRVFRDLLRASYSGFAVEGPMILPRVDMIVCDQPEERALLCPN